MNSQGMTQEEFEREPTSAVDKSKKKKKNLKDVVSSQDFEKIAERLKEYTDNYLRYLSAKEIK